MRLAKLLGSLLVVGVACKDGAPIQPTATKPLASKIVKAPSVSADKKANSDPKSQFHGSNTVDWVGKAHNKALEDIFASILPRMDSNVCFGIESLAAAPERIPSGKEKSTGQSRNAVARNAMLSTGLCSSDLADAQRRTGRLASLRKTTANEPMALDDISPEAHGVLDQIGNAVTTATSSGGLAANLNVILTQMPALSGTDVEVINAVASVSQSSYEYWEVNASILTSQVSTSYGSCLGQYANEADALQNCMGITIPIGTPTKFERRHRDNTSGNFGLASNTSFVRRCVIPEISDFGEPDFVGAGLGAIAGVFGPPGILLGGLVGGAATSGLTAMYRTGTYIWCLNHGGISVRQQTT